MAFLHIPNQVGGPAGFATVAALSLMFTVDAAARPCVKWHLPQSFQISQTGSIAHLNLERAPPSPTGGNAVAFYGRASAMRGGGYKQRRQGDVTGTLTVRSFSATVKWRGGGVTTYTFPVRQLSGRGSFGPGRASDSSMSIRTATTLRCATHLE